MSQKTPSEKEMQRVVPLERVTRDGRRYVRPRRVESAIARALALSEAELMHLLIAKEDQEELRSLSECLVYLVRRLPLRSPLQRAALRSLLDRCRKILTRTPIGRRYDAHEVRDEVFSDFCQVVARDASTPTSGALDFFEVNFQQALGTLLLMRLRNIRRSWLTISPNLTVPDPPDAASLESTVLATELRRGLMKLSPSHRDAVILAHIKRIPIDGNSTTGVTVSEICGVSGKTIRARVKKGIASLRRWVE